MIYRSLTIAFSLLLLIPLTGQRWPVSISSVKVSPSPSPWTQRDRCGTPERMGQAPGQSGDPTDCGYWTNSPQPEYDPTFYYDIPVVFHVIQNTSGAGVLSASTIQDQIDVLNEDFQAIVGSPGAPGTNANISFYLATNDPQGNSTNGITYSTNNNWYFQLTSSHVTEVGNHIHNLVHR